MRTRSRFVAGLFLACATALATLALAQPKKGPTKPPVKPPAVKDAAPEKPEENGTADAGKPPEKEGPVTAPVTEVSDAGTRPSPLNPQKEEMPQANPDAGVPIDYDRLLADIAALRARVSALADSLYQSRISVAVQTDGDHAKIGRFTVALDDGVVYTAPSAFAASDMTTVYDHAVAPGRHAVTIDVERKDDRDDSFRTSQKSRFTVDVPRDHKVDVQIKVIDDSSMGADFPSDRSGKYDLRFRVKAVAKPAVK